MDTKKIIGDVLLELADAMESGGMVSRPSVGITTIGSEHGEEVVLNGACAAAKSGLVSVVAIGSMAPSTLLPNMTFVQVASEEEAHNTMESLLENGTIDACVTMHYTFPIGVSTVGRVVTPAQGNEMLIATTTGTSATDRIKAMVLNAVYGVITAKALGKAEPTVGIANVEGARSVERALASLRDQGYPLHFAESRRADGGTVMRGNDLLMGSADVMVTDSLTGNLLMKMFSSFTTGGSYEASGYGYGCGVGLEYDKMVLIISRASGSPVISNAILHAGELVKGGLMQVVAAERAALKKAGFDALLSGLGGKKEQSAVGQPVADVPKEVVTEAISGIEIMELEDAVLALLRKGIYAESGMGCTGPIVLVNESNFGQAQTILAESGFCQ